MEKFTKKRGLSKTLGSKEDLTNFSPPPIFRNTVGTFGNNSDLRGSVER